MKRRALLFLACAAGVACAAAVGCSRTKKDAPAVAARVVSLSPSTTEALFAIGAGSNVVGRSRYCDYPPEALALPQVGGYVDPNLEAILALRPDLVVGARGPAGTKYTDALASHGVATLFPETESLAAIDAMIRDLGARTGHVEEAARETARLDAHIAAIAKATSWLPKVRALLVFGIEPVVVAGPGGFPDEVIAKAGGVNAVTEGTAYPTLGMERVIALDPDVILDAAIMEGKGAERITKDAPGWREVRAVQRGRVVAVGDEVVLRPGPRIDQGIATIAHALHPDAKVP
jgi:iron complex transport system substrate-binding protein